MLMLYSLTSQESRPLPSESAGLALSLSCNMMR